MYYNVRELEKDTIYRMVKFDSLYNVESIYVIYRTTRSVNCTCFQKDKSTCRHRQMLNLFIEKRLVSTGWAYEYESGEWVRPPNAPVLAATKRREK